MSERSLVTQQRTLPWPGMIVTVIPGLSGRSVHSGPSRRIPPSRFRSKQAASQRAAKTDFETLFKDRPAGTGQDEDASRQDRELRLEGRRLGRLRGGSLRITCGCGHSGDVPVLALVSRHGQEARVGDAAASMRCSACGGRRIREIRWLASEDDKGEGRNER